MRRSLLVLLAAVGLVLLIACINVSSLFARARRRAAPRVLGATRARRVARATRAAIPRRESRARDDRRRRRRLFAVWGSRALAEHAPQELVRGYHVAVDGRVLAVTAAIAALTAIVISLLPAFQQPERALAGALRDEGRAMSGGPARQRTSERAFGCWNAGSREITIAVRAAIAAVTAARVRRPRRVAAQQRLRRVLREQLRSPDGEPTPSVAADRHEHETLGEELPRSRARDAPSARRTENSRRRAAACASSKLETLMHAMSSTRPTAASSTSSERRLRRPGAHAARRRRRG